MFPKFYQERGDGWSPSTLSLWRDIESAMAFSYFGLHAIALKRGSEWNVKPEWPPYAAWWIEEGYTPDWHEAVMKHERLHNAGPTVAVFNFKDPFDANGHRMAVDRTRIKAIAMENKLTAK